VEKTAMATQAAVVVGVALMLQEPMGRVLAAAAAAATAVSHSRGLLDGLLHFPLRSTCILADI
jgi:hypothetical protein